MQLFKDRGVLVTKLCPTLVTPWTVAFQAPLSMGFSRQEYWSELPFPSPGDLPDLGIELRSPALQADSLPIELHRKPKDYGETSNDLRPTLKTLTLSVALSNNLLLLPPPNMYPNFLFWKVQGQGTTYNISTRCPLWLSATREDFHCTWHQCGRELQRWRTAAISSILSKQLYCIDNTSSCIRVVWGQTNKSLLSVM